MHSFVQNIVPLIFLLPAALSIVLAIFLWFMRPVSETVTRFLVGKTFFLVTLLCFFLAGYMITQGVSEIHVSLGTWFFIDHYHFDWPLMIDGLSMPIATLVAVLVGLIAAFSHRYLHREPGFGRFFFLLSLFGAALELVVLAGSLDLIFFGWELVGLTSVLLIAFFYERKNPVIHGLRAFITYRICDIGLLGATIWLHHVAGSSLLSGWRGSTWLELPGAVTGGHATFIGLLLLWAAMGKSAQVPMGGWLPRAMEGPTPSSAIFYGALSIHLGPYLLLRSWPIFMNSAVATLALMLVGLATAFHASIVGRVQSDIKSTLAYASMTQVGIIFVEISLGFHIVALVHIIGHALIRSLQILRSPSLLHDHRHLEQAMGQLLVRTGGHFEKVWPEKMQRWFYRYALERGHLDSLTLDYFVRGFVMVFRRLDALDLKLAQTLSRPFAPVSIGEQDREVL